MTSSQNDRLWTLSSRRQLQTLMQLILMLDGMQMCNLRELSINLKAVHDKIIRMSFSLLIDLQVDVTTTSLIIQLSFSLLIALQVDVTISLIIKLSFLLLIALQVDVMTASLYHDFFVCFYFFNYS